MIPPTCQATVARSGLGSGGRWWVDLVVSCKASSFPARQVALLGRQAEVPDVDGKRNAAMAEVLSHGSAGCGGVMWSCSKLSMLVVSGLHQGSHV